MPDISETVPSVGNSTARQQRAKEYDRLHNWLFLVDLGLMAVLLVVLMWGDRNGLSFAMERFASGIVGTNPWAVTAGYVVILLSGYTLFFLPYSWWKGFCLEHRYDLSNQSFFNWLWDEIKSFALTLILAIIVFEIFYALLRVAGSSWWIWAACAWIILQVLLGMVFPVLVLPLFYKTVKLDRPDLIEKIGELALTAGISILGVFRIDLSEKTKKANAMLAGLGNTKRILMGDTLLDSFSEDEVISVLAHEFGHYYHKHIWKLIAVASISAFAGMWVADHILNIAAGWLDIPTIATIATAPLLVCALVLFSLLSMPVTNLLSRYFERQADRYALDTTGNAQAFISAMNRLADQNLANKEPSPVIEFLLHSHPSIAKRISFARSWSSNHD
jgi:STE24 endopeptidase